MTEIVIRQSGGASIVILPKSILKTMNLEAGSRLDLKIEGDKIVLTPLVTEPTLEELLRNSPKDNFRVTEEDREWINAKPRGCEI